MNFSLVRTRTGSGRRQHWPSETHPSFTKIISTLAPSPLQLVDYLESLAYAGLTTGRKFSILSSLFCQLLAQEDHTVFSSW